MSGRFVVVGDALIDELRDPRSVREFVGGAALNVAVGIARLGQPATLIAMVGDDEDGARIRAFLADFGVELIATPAPHGSARAVSTRGDTGEPVYEFNRAAQDRRIRFGDAERKAMTDAAAVVVSCFRFDDTAQAAELEDALGDAATLFVDPNPRAGMLADAEEFVRGFEAVAAAATLVKVGADDAALLYRRPLDALRTRLVDLGAAAVLATEGASGATIEAGAIVVTRPVTDLPGPIVDTMGAGDAALAAAVVGVAELAPADESGWGAVLQKAMDVAAATCRFEGALLRLPSALAEADLDRIGT